MSIWKAHLTVVKYANDKLRMFGTSRDGGSKVVFEVVASTDKPDSVASQKSIATINPLII